jgi:hypothetical protein
MKISFESEEVTASEMTDWIAQLREDGHGDPSGEQVWYPAPAVPAAPLAEAPLAPLPLADEAAPPEPAGAGPEPAWAETPPEPPAWAEAPPEPPAGAAAAPVPAPRAWTGREPAPSAPIGDELRIPIAWCEMGPCISHFTDPAALGEADVRSRAIAAGWQVDALGRLTCPQCQQTISSFRAVRPVVPWNRREAVAKLAGLATSLRDGGAAGSVSHAEPELSRAAEPATAPTAPTVPAAVSAAGAPPRGRHRRHN